ncbi:MAG: PVC-type heme-binding CxxCH protein [Pirellulales bacterium]
MLRCLVGAVVALSLLVPCPAADGPPPPESRPASLRIAPKEPADALAAFQTRDGFRMDLLAAEPLVTDPVAMEYDENGRALVVEMSDYPYTDKSTDRPFVERTTDLPLGRLRLLEDKDGDGVFDASTIFADGLSWPTGLALWQGGVYVAATPDIWYLRDSDGDGRADQRRKVFTGFHKFNVQAVMNNLRWGLDHRLYGAGGTNGGEIRRLADGQGTPVRMGAHDFRFDPRTEEFELISGGARFGNAFDDWGNRFISNIRNPVRHAVIEDRYLARNPLLSIASPLFDAADAGDTLPIFRTSPPEPWRVINAQRLAADLASASPRSESSPTGYVTSACGITVYRGAAYPREYRGQAFLGEVAGNLVHRQRLTAEGLTFRAARADQGTEFVTSTDNWFRPVNFVNAPDGTLHVLDMYRETIEHPWSIPDDIKEQLDLESGRDRGRIYRLTPPGFQPPPRPRLGQADIAELVACLENPSAWWRETAQRLLYERQDASAAPLLRELLCKRPSAAENGPDVAALGRLHALWSLEGLGMLGERDLAAALADPAGGVREHAVRLAEPRLATSSLLRDKVLALAEDRDIRVRGQVALTLGQLGDHRATAAIAEIARRDGGDYWLRTAVLSSPDRIAADLLTSLLDRRRQQAATMPLLRSLAFFVGARNQAEELRRALVAVAPGDPPAPDWVPLARREVVLGLSEGLARHGTPLSDRAGHVEPAAAGWIAGLVREAALLAVDESAPAAERVQAIALIGQGPFEDVREAAARLLDPRQPGEVQLAAVQALTRHVRPEVPGVLLAAYRGLTPAVRAEVVERLLSRSEWSGTVLDALEDRTLPPADIPHARRGLLMRSGDPLVRQRALALFSEVLGSRQEVVREYRQALELAADYERGGQVYQRACRNCHRLGGQGHDVGPPLETIHHRSAGEVLLHVLDPNREVSPNYLEYVVVLTDGRVATGIVAAETPGSITLRRAEGVQETVLRRDIDALSTTGKSIMPEGVEKELTPQDMADLLAFLLRRT